MVDRFIYYHLKPVLGTRCGANTRGIMRRDYVMFVSCVSKRESTYKTHNVVDQRCSIRSGHRRIVVKCRKTCKTELRRTVKKEELRSCRKECRKERKARKRRRDSPLGIESELDLRLLGIKTFETSTGQQDRLQLNHSSSRILFRSFSRDPNMSFSLSSPLPVCFLLFPRRCFPHPRDSSSVSFLSNGPFQSAFIRTHRTRGPPSPLPRSSSRLVFSPLSVLPLSRPDLGASRLHVACPNDVSERTGTTAI